MENTKQDASTESLVAVTSNQLPSFFHDYPHLWFEFEEAEFNKSRIILDRLKFSNILTYLTFDVAAQVVSKSTYVELRDAVLQRVAASETTRFHQLLRGLTLEDKRPSPRSGANDRRAAMPRKTYSRTMAPASAFSGAGDLSHS